MLDYQRIIDDVRTALLAASSERLGFVRSGFRAMVFPPESALSAETVAFLRAAAAAYHAACDEVNERLRRCGSLLRQGQRSEALRLANTEPALPGVVATLNFPERDQWVAVLEAFRLSPPPPLLLQVAADLKEAYAREEPLAAMLSQHRKLALSQSPLRERIELLRKIAGVDAENPIWRSDLAGYERERHKQLENEVIAAAGAGDFAALATLDSELRSGPWTVAPPDRLLERAANSRAMLLRRKAQADLESLAGQLNDAFGSFDVERGRSLRGRWGELLRALKPASGDPVLERAAPALEWLRAEDQREAGQRAHQEAVSALAAALDRQRPREILVRAYETLAQVEPGVTEELEARYRAQLEELKQAAARRARRWTISLVTGALLALVGAIFAYRWWQNSVADAQDAAKLTSLMEAGKLDEARDFVDRLRQQGAPSLDGSRIQGLLADLHEREREESERRAAFHAALAQIDAAGPGESDMDSLTKAESLARTEAEKIAVLAARKKVDLAEAEKRRIREGQFKTSLTAIEQRIAAMEGQRSDSVADVSSLKNELATLNQRYETVAPGLADQWRPLESRIDRLANAAQARGEQDAGEASITEAVGNREKFRQALTRYAKSFPDSAQSKQFKRVTTESDLWLEVDHWNAFLEQWRKPAAGELSPPSAAKFVSAVREFCERNPHWATVGLLEQRARELESVARRVDDKHYPIQNSLEKLFHDRLMTGVTLVETKDGHRYYSFQEPTFDANGLAHVRYLLDFSLAEKTRDMKATDLQEKPRAAPQAALAARIDPLLKRLSNENWEATFLDMLHELCRPDAATPPVDPLLRLHLVQKTLAVGCQGSYPLALALERQMRMVRESQVSPIANWLDPDSPETEAVRPIARRELEAIGDPSTARAAVMQRVEATHAPLGKRLEWVGWLRSGAKGNWECRSRTSPPQDGRLFVIGNTGANHTLTPIGHAVSGEFVIEATGEPLVEGRPVYLAE